MRQVGHLLNVYKHQFLLQNLIVAHLLGKFIAVCTQSLLVFATEPNPESAPSIPSYIQLLRKIHLNFNVSSTSCSSKWSRPFVISSYKIIYAVLIFSLVSVIILHFVAVKMFVEV